MLTLEYWALAKHSERMTGCSTDYDSIPSSENM